MLNIGASSKNLANFWASMVAEEIKSFSSGLNLAMSLTSPKRMSVCRVLSWASSIINAEYAPRSGSVRNSLSSMPSVMYFRIVLSDVASSKRIA